MACKGEAPVAPPPAPTPGATADTSPPPAPPPDAEPTDTGAAAGAADTAPAAPPVALIGVSATEPPEADRIYCEGPLDGKKDWAVATAQGRIALRAMGPEGTVLEAQGNKHTLGKDGAPIELEVLGAMLGNGREPGGYGLLDYKAHFDLAWTLPDGKSGQGTLTCRAGTALFKALSAVRKGPLRWPNEGEQRYLDDVVVVAATGGLLTLHGDSDATLYNADFIALERDVVRKLSSCPYVVVDAQTGRPTGTNLTKEREAVDVVIEVYDRRSGRRIKGKTFTAPTPECPEQIPVDEVLRTAAERGDTGTYYEDLVKERPVDGLGEIPPPAPKVEVELGGGGVPERKLPSIAALEKKIRAAGFKPSGEVSRNAKDDPTDFLWFSSDMPNSEFITFDLADWSRAPKPQEEYMDPGVYAIGPRFAIMVVGTPSVATRTLELLAKDLPADALGIHAALAPSGWKPSEAPDEYDKRPDVPAVNKWDVTFKKDDDVLFVTVVDWGDVADGKTNLYAVARSKDAFVVIDSTIPGQASEVLDKLLK